MPATVAQRERPWYRRELATAYAAATGRSPHRKQLDLMVELNVWLDIVAAREPDAIVRTCRQFVQGPGRRLGWKTTGTARGDHSLYGNRISRGLDYLKLCGRVADRRYVQEASGEGVGIMVVPGPCSSTGDATAASPRRLRRAAETGPQCPESPRPHVRNGRRRVRLLRDILAASRGFSSPSLSPPFGALDPVPSGPGSRATAREQYTRARRALGAADRAALEGWWETARVGWSEPGGAELLQAVPVLGELPVVAMARAVFSVVHPKASPVISSLQRDRLEVAVRRLDRFADFGAGREGAGREVVLDLILGDWREHALERSAAPRQRVPTPRYVEPKTLGGIAVCARRVANRWRRGERSRRTAA